MGPHRRAPRSVRKVLNCATCPTSRAAEWCALDDAGIEILNNVKATHGFFPGEALFHEGNPCGGIYSVESGTVGIFKTDHKGRSLLLRLVHAGQTIGYSDYFGKHVHTVSAETLTECTICFIPDAGMKQLLAHEPALANRFLQHTIADLDRAKVFAVKQAWLPARARLADLLLDLRERYGKAGASGQMEIHLPLSRQDIANMLGTSVETVHRAFHELRQSGVLDVDNRTVTVRDLDELMDVVESA